MNNISNLDLKGFMLKVIKDVFETMVSMDLEFSDPNPANKIYGNRIVGSVGLAGDVQGNVRIHVTEEFARVITAAMLGMELDEIEGEEEVHDVIGELSNMISGGIKSRICDAGVNCNLSAPTITSGSDYEIISQDCQICEQLFFSNEDDNTALSEIAIKLNN